MRVVSTSVYNVTNGGPRIIYMLINYADWRREGGFKIVHQKGELFRHETTPKAAEQQLLFKTLM